ncbi:MAG: UvrD-helicase domain-containing protein [Clostridia bacterium]|nr:UvrD-helicase domain-containing protein [Clostridia bacterium]
MSEAVVIEKKEEFKPTPEQEAAMTHNGSDLLISAGAGSGKTATLTDRIVKRICEMGMDISRMLVVTYTKDASNELKVRIAKKLSERLKANPSNHHLSSQLVKVTSADISTIHSFCLRCLRPHFDKLGIDSDFRIGEDNELAILKKEAMNEVIDSFFEDETIDADFLIVSDCYSEFTNEDVLPQSLLGLYTNLISTSKGLELLLEPVSNEKEFLNTKYGQVLVKQLNRLINHFMPIVSQLIEDIKGEDVATKKYLNTYASLLEMLERIKNGLSIPSYDILREAFADYKPVPFAGGSKKSSLNVELITAVRDELKESFEKYRDKFFASDSAAVHSALMQNEKCCHAIYKILKRFDECYKSKKRRYSLCDFNDLERYTLQLFYDEKGEITPIAKDIGLKYDDIYIDEYQDNNSVQDRIFFAISRNNRFMVGDIKQSIYGFRSAEPELFSHYRDTFVPYGERVEDEGVGRTIFMSDNFRCDKSIIEMTNRVSDFMFLNSSGFKYVEGDRLKHSKKHKGDFTPQNAELCLIDKRGIEKDSPLGENRIQAEFVAREIKRLLDSGTLPNGEKIKPKHIAILLRAKRNHAEKYIDALNKYRIKNEYVQDVKFFEKPHVLLMLNILNSIDNPSKDIYLAGCMCSEIYGFTLGELVQIKSQAQAEQGLYTSLISYDGDDALKSKINSFLKALEDYRRSIRKMSAESAISFIMNETGFLSFCNKTEREDIIKLYNIARSYEQGSYKGLYSFLRYVDDISVGKMKETVSDSPDDSVKIVTMHASKGLEYEICFLCDTESLFSSKGYTAPLLFDKRLGVCGYVGREGGIVKYDNLIRKCASLSIKEAEQEEAMRLIYVAMTRARSKLYIVASLSNPQTHIDTARLWADYNDEYTIYSKKSHIAIILGACPYPLDFLDERRITQEDLLDGYDTEKDAEPPDMQETERIKDELKRRFDFEYKYEHFGKLPSKLSISSLYPYVLDDEDGYSAPVGEIDDIPDFLAEKDELFSGAERGTATHTFLQFCDFDSLIKNGSESELNRLIEQSFISPAVKELIDLEHIDIFAHSELMAELTSAKRVIREFRFNVLLDAKEFTHDELLQNERILVQGVTDCIYETAQGELILVDYKTDKVTEENYIEKLTSSHRLQLTYYKRAVEMMFERPLSRVLIYSVPLGKTVEIL